MTIPVSSILSSGRARADVKYGDLETLKASIKSVGLIQPIVVSRSISLADVAATMCNGGLTESVALEHNATFTLVAGGRRLRAIKELGVDVLHHGSTLNPDALGFVFADEVPEHIRLESELDENLHRLGMDWIDTALLIYRTHQAKRSVDPSWNQKKTTQLLGYDSEASVSNYIRAAKEILAGNTEVLACKSVRDANILYYKRREDAALAELQKRNAAKIGTAPASATSPVLDKALNVLLTLEPTSVVDPFAHTSARAQVPLSAQFFLRDSILDPNPWPLVDHVVTDIPYGIDMDNLDEKQVEDVRDTHDVDSNVDLMPAFLLKAFQATKPGGFCVFFYDLDHHEKLQFWAKNTGWKVQRWPFIACKISACQNNCAQYNLTKNYEVAMFLRKDSNTVLRKQQPTSWRSYDFAAERKLYNNPFAKPFALWKDIYDAIAFPGQSVLDPFAGEMSACRAAANCGLMPYGIEVDERHYNRGLEHMKAVYAQIYASNCDFV